MKNSTNASGIIGRLALCVVAIWVSNTVCNRSSSSGSNSSVVNDGATLKSMEGGKQYEDAESHYAISFPQSWMTDPSGREVKASSPAEKGAVFAPNVQVMMQELPSTISTGDLLNKLETAMEKLTTNYSLIEEHTGQVNGHEAARFSFKGINSQYPGEIESFMLLETNGQTLYHVGGVALAGQYERLKPTFEGIFGSFKITD